MASSVEAHLPGTDF